MRAARSAPTTTGSIGTPAAAYSAWLAIARLQKCGGVHRNSTSASSSASGADLRVDRRRAGQHRKAAGQAADDDVPGVRRFSPSV